MVDVHCHIVPGVDDGAESLDVALQMVDAARTVGIDAIVTTPHIASQRADIRLHEIHQEEFQRLRQRVKDFDLKLAGEVRVTAEALEVVDERCFTIGEEGKYILLELPPREVPHYFPSVLFEYRLRGVTPIIAHPERYPGLASRPDFIFEYLNLGAHLQITTASLTGEHGPLFESFAKALIKCGAVSIVASDSHNLTSRTFDSWTGAVEVLRALEGEEHEGNWSVETLTTTNPRAVFDGKPLEPVEISESARAKALLLIKHAIERPAEKRKRFFFF